MLCWGSRRAVREAPISRLRMRKMCSTCNEFKTVARTRRCPNTPLDGLCNQPSQRKRKCIAALDTPLPIGRFPIGRLHGTRWETYGGGRPRAPSMSEPRLGVSFGGPAGRCVPQVDGTRVGREHAHPSSLIGLV